MIDAGLQAVALKSRSDAGFFIAKETECSVAEARVCGSPTPRAQHYMRCPIPEPAVSRCVKYSILFFRSGSVFLSNRLA